MPADRHESRLHSAGRRLHAIAVPATRRPDDFLGAVGRFEMEMMKDPGSVDVADGSRILHLRLAVRGDGFLDASMLPSLAEAPGFQVRGQRIEKLPDGLVQHVELRRSAGTADDVMPAVSWSYFDPSRPARFETIRLGTETTGETQGSSKLPWLVGGGILFIIGMLSLLRRRPAAEERVVQEAVEAKTRPKPPPHDLIDELARLLGISRDQVYATDLRARLATTTVPPELAEELAVAVAAIMRRRFAQDGVGIGEEQERSLRRRLHAAVAE
jgi:hypothetical protein